MAEEKRPHRLTGAEALTETGQPTLAVQPPAESTEYAQSLTDVGKEAQKYEPPAPHERAGANGTPQPDSGTEGISEAAESMAQEELSDVETRMEAIQETGVPYIGPPPIASSLHDGRQQSNAGQPEDMNQLPSRPETGGAVVGGETPTTPGEDEEPHTEVTPEGPKPDVRRSPGERIRRGATH